jgi:SAM-dependent methyltransferase
MEYSEKYKFTEKWFDGMIPLWEQVFKDFSKIENVLEIGCYEGRATIWLCENVLNDSSKKYNYDIIDTFGGSLNESGMEGTKKRLKEDNFIENNFNHNTSFFPHINFNIHKGYSQEILPTFKVEEKYDFIYIDASHRADDTFVDAYFAHKLLKKGGLLIFDDYGWKDPHNLHPSNSPQLGVDVFNTIYDEQFKPLFNGYQVGFIKL